MAVKKKSGKKLKAGASVKKSSKVSKKAGSKVAKPAKGGKVKGVLKAAGGVVDRAMGAYTGSTLSDIKAGYKSGSKGVGGRRRRKGVVPKTVKKWASKITRRRKQEEKIVKKLFGAEGGKIVKKPKVSRYGSPGVITRQEMNEAIRR